MRYLVLTRIHTANIQTSAYFDSINKIPDMILTAHKLGMAGLALTDHECLGGHVKWLLAEKELKEISAGDDFSALLKQATEAEQLLE